MKFEYLNWLCVTSIGFALCRKGHFHEYATICLNVIDFAWLFVKEMKFVLIFAQARQRQRAICHVSTKSKLCCVVLSFTMSINIHFSLTILLNRKYLTEQLI